MMGFTRFNSRQHRRKIIFLILFIAFIYFVSRRDSLYLLRPIWDKKPQPFNTYSFWPYVPAIESDKDYCRHYGWQQRQVGNRKSPRIIDATMISTEVSLFKLRLMETRDHVDMVIVVEADRSFDGTPKPHFPIFNETEIRPYMKDSQVLVYHNDAQYAHGHHSRSSTWHNHGDLILMSDVDEISSKETLQLAKVCSLPPILHLNMRDYLYSFEFPLNDNGYWRPKIVTFEATTTFGYNHIRASDELLLHAGWHCSWCFRSIQEYHIKMTGYSHNDRLTSSSQLLPSEIQRKICTGLDIYDMYPEAYTFTDLLRQLGPAPRATEYTHLPAYTTMLQNPEFRFLLPGFCERPLDMLVS
ncbi:glycosyl transferase [Multifurca ochricompacta]|uniref:Glycosyl transferase n=1 Tax=Multifurca ochricompacta TaxID=376703 RepID=A0AAD4QJG2_9AGAM|nr:glycosyl transferase [Multifurca ochricompacta]